MVYPVLLCMFASLSTGLGGVIAAFFQNISDRTMSFFQGFAAGVMITVSFLEMFPHCYENLAGYLAAEYAALALLALLLSGWLAGCGISYAADYIYRDKKEYSSVMRICVVTTAVMVLHNLPEGMLTVFSGVEDKQFGLKMAVAVALHNIPEGLVVAGNAMYLSPSRLKAAGQSFLAGISEFVGGFAAVVVFNGITNGLFTGIVLAAVGGMMVQISVCELLPSALKLSGKVTALTGVLAGAAVMYISLHII